MPKKIIVAETPNIRAILQDFSGDGFVFTFNEAAFVRDGDRFWGDTMLGKERIASIGFVTPGPSWYPQAEMQFVIREVLRYASSRRVLCFGFSQGGYGALKFSKRLGASSALAFSPQSSINPADVGHFDRRFSKYFQPELQNGIQIEKTDVCERSFAVIDRKETFDRLHFARLNNVSLVCAPFLWHATIKLVSEGKVGPAILKYCLEASANSGGVRRILRQARKSSQTYLQICRAQLLTRLLRSISHRSTRFLSAINRLCSRHRDLFECLIKCIQDGTVSNAENLRTRIKEDDLYGLDGFSLLLTFLVCRRMHLSDCEDFISQAIFYLSPENTLGNLHAVFSLIRSDRRADAASRLAKMANENLDASHFGDGFLRAAARLRDKTCLQLLQARAAPGLERQLADSLLQKYERRTAGAKCQGQD